jgi:cytoskeleton protein RodZ
MNRHDSDASLTDKKRLTAGQVLAERREKLGLSIEECAETLKLSVSKIKALEADNDDPFPSEIFQRGYLKNYAKLVDLSANDVLYYHDSQRQAHNVRIENEASEERGKPNKKWWLPYLLAVFIVFTWFVVSNEAKLANYWQSDALSLEPQFEADEEQGSVDARLTNNLTVVAPILLLDAPSSYSTINENQPTAVVVAPSEPVVELFTSGVQAQAKQQDASTRSEIDDSSPIIDVPLRDSAIETIDVQKSDTLPSNALESKIDSQASAITQVEEDRLSRPKALISEASLVSDLLYFTFLEACWVEVVDATNKTIVSSIRKANSELLVEGRSPFSVVFGNINGATLRFNDKPVDLANSADGRTLRVTVGG